MTPADALEAALGLWELFMKMHAQPRSVREKSSALACLGGVFGVAGAKPKAPLKGGLRIAMGAVADALSTLPLSGMIIGGVAVVARGVPRTTRDVDLTVEGGKLALPDLVAQLELVGFEPRIDGAIAFATANRVLLVRHTSSGVDIDLLIAWLPFETEAIAVAETLNLLSENSVVSAVPSPSPATVQRYVLCPAAPADAEARQLCFSRRGGWPWRQRRVYLRAARTRTSVCAPTSRPARRAAAAAAVYPERVQF